MKCNHLKTIRKGDVFLFAVNGKYGLIQVIEKGKIAGYNVRIFYDLIENIDIKSINNIVCNSDFYFIKNFYKHDLLYKSYSKISYKLTDKIIVPRYLRSCETDTNDKVIWYVIDSKKGQVVNVYKEYSNELDDLSPSETWGIEYIIKRWSEGFTLKKWNDFRNEWLLDYRKNKKTSHCYIKATAIKLIDNSSYPEVVLLYFCDKDNNKHEIIEKWPVVSKQEFTNEFPKDCYIGCTIIEEKDSSYIVSTLDPWSIESTEGIMIFEINKELLIKEL